MRKLTAERVTPVGFGRNQADHALLQELLADGAVDVLRPDIVRNGITRIRKLAAFAETYYVAVAPHHDGGPVATAAALHLAASLPNFFAQQIPFTEAAEDRRMRQEIGGAQIEIVKDGYAQLPTGPGLGVTINEAALGRYRDGVA